jgi:hypothetical protein
MTSRLKPSPKPDNRPRCPCGSLLDRHDISNDARGRRVCWSCRSLAGDSPSAEAQRVMDAMAKHKDDYSAMARAALKARRLPA